MGAGRCEPLELGDVQGLVARGYGEPAAAARSCCVGIEDARGGAALARRAIAGMLTTADARPDGAAVNIAFTSSGLAQLGVDAATVARAFSNEFVDGMTTAAPHAASSATSTRTRRSAGTGAARARPTSTRCCSSTRATTAALAGARGASRPAALGAGVCRCSRRLDTSTSTARAVRLPRRHLAAVRRGAVEAGPARDDACAPASSSSATRTSTAVHGPAAARRPLRPRAQRHLPRLPPAAPGRPRLLALPRRATRRADGSTDPSARAAPRREDGRALAERRAARARARRATIRRSPRRTTSPTSSTTRTARAARSARTSAARIRATRSIRSPGTAESWAINRRHRILRRGREYGHGR